MTFENFNVVLVIKKLLILLNYFGDINGKKGFNKNVWCFRPHKNRKLFGVFDQK